jgi:hypothetical protein
MKRLALVILGVGLLAAPGINAAASAEKLVQPMPLPGGPWKKFQRKQDDMLQTMWVKDGRKEILGTIVSYKERDKTALEFKTEDDRIGRKVCDEFSSRILANDLENGYKALTWTSSCSRQGFKSVTLRKVINGEDALYGVQRIWRGDGSPKNWNTWVDYMKRIEVCDAGSKDHPCPRKRPR